ncbi:MAG: FkbM family methyltransferase [Gemmataceae bacterium]
MSILVNLFGYVPTSWVRAAGAMRGRSAWLKRATDWLPDLLRNRDGRIKNGLGRGLRFNGGGSAVGFVLGTHDMDVQYALGKLLRPGMTVYDIGANVGFTALIAARQVTDAGRVICFEPLASNADLIRRNADLNGFRHVQSRQEAVGGADGEAEFFLSASPTWGRLADAGAAPAQTGTTRVTVRSLDSVVAAESLPRPDLIKMDVEGAEAEALRGAVRLLAEARPLMIIELHHTNGPVMDVLEGLGYAARVLGSDDDVRDPRREVQILAYPRHREAEVAPLLADLIAGRMTF